jgi:large conductance mechanosensitive channel
MANSDKQKHTDSAAPKASKSAAAKAAATARKNALKSVNATRTAQPLNGFMNFVREQGVIGLAIGLALGAQVKSLVDQIVASFINPLVGLVLPGQGDLTKKTFSFTFNDKVAVFTYGNFLNVLISFIAVAAVIYFVIKGLKLDKIDKPKDK